jgi:uncharacterized protein YabN with tetrapyrrole methylase and pyrophosphatase domain
LEELVGAAIEGRSESVGPLLFAVVEAARALGVDAEEALRSASLRFRDQIIECERSADPGEGSHQKKVGGR